MQNVIAKIKSSLDKKVVYMCIYCKLNQYDMYQSFTFWYLYVITPFVV